MVLSDQQLEALLLKSFEYLDKVKETCKVTMSQCLQIQYTTNSILRSCLETIDTVDLCKMFIVNRSPNTKECVKFTMKVIKTNMEECDKVRNEQGCKDMIKFCEKVLDETYKILKKLHDSI